MAIVDIDEAKLHLSKLIMRVTNGEEIMITEYGQPVARLLPIGEEIEKRVPGNDEGKVVIHPNFDDQFPEFDL